MIVKDLATLPLELTIFFPSTRPFVGVVIKLFVIVIGLLFLLVSEVNNAIVAFTLTVELSNVTYSVR